MSERDDNEKIEATERKKRMDDTEIRIGSTGAGYDFLQRVREIGRPKPLRARPEETESDDQ